jgi:hypothetical protein
MISLQEGPGMTTRSSTSPNAVPFNIPYPWILLGSIHPVSHVADKRRPHTRYFRIQTGALVLLAAICPAAYTCVYAA